MHIYSCKHVYIYTTWTAVKQNNIPEKLFKVSYNNYAHDKQLATFKTIALKSKP